jgi:hypothetical protein
MNMLRVMLSFSKQIQKKVIENVKQFRLQFVDAVLNKIWNLLKIKYYEKKICNSSKW